MEIEIERISSKIPHLKYEDLLFLDIDPLTLYLP